MAGEIGPAGASKGLVDRAQAIVMSPATEWPVVAAETDPPQSVLLKYALPLIAIGPICAIVGGMIAPYSLGLTYYASTAFVSFLLGVGSLFLLSLIANLLSPKFGGKDDYASAFRLMTYAYTPVWLLGLINLLLPFSAFIGVLQLLGLYSLYLFYLGATPVMAVPQDKAVGYTVVTVLCAIVVYIVATAITAMIIAAFVVSTAATAVVVYS